MNITDIVVLSYFHSVSYIAYSSAESKIYSKTSTSCAYNDGSDSSGIFSFDLDLNWVYIAMLKT